MRLFLFSVRSKYPGLGQRESPDADDGGGVQSGIRPAGQSVREADGEDCDDPTGEGGQGIPGKEDIAVHAH